MKYQVAKTKGVEIRTFFLLNGFAIFPKNVNKMVENKSFSIYLKGGIRLAPPYSVLVHNPQS